MRIVFDAQGALGGSRHRGIGRYTKSFLREFARLAQQHDLYILLNTMLPEAHNEVRLSLAGLVSSEKFITWSAEPPIGAMHFENWGRRAFAREIYEEVIASLEPDLLIISSMFEGAEDDAVCSIDPSRDYIVATICYDLIPMIYRQHYLLHPGMEAYYRRQLEVLRRSDLLLAISQSAADEAVQLLRYPRERVQNIGAAVDRGFAQPCELELNRRFGITRPYLFYVSAFEVRKNHARLIEAYAKLPEKLRSRHQLVLGGGVGNTEDLKRVAFGEGLSEDQVIFTGSVDDGELAALYHRAKAVVFPSWHEGFGLPILEAMVFGKAVIASNRSSMPEVIGDKEALFDPFNSHSISASIVRVLTDDEFRARLEHNAIVRVANFSWEKSAHAALTFLESGVARWPRSRDYGRRFAANALMRVKNNPRLLGFRPDVATQHIARSFRRGERRQLLIDISRLIVEDAHTGIQRVVRAILANLLKYPPTGWVIEPVYATPNELGYRYARSFADRLLGLEQPWHEDRPVEVWSGDILCILDLEPDVLVAQRSVLNEWRLQGAQVFTVVHDILPLLLPNYFPESVGKEVMGRWIDELAKHDGAICVSETVAGQLKHWMQQNNVEINPAFRFDWFHHGSDIEESFPTRGIPAAASSVFKIMADRTTALMVGTLEPRKGHTQALEAFEQLWREGLDFALVIVGKKGWRVEHLEQRLRKHPEFGRRLIWLERASDEFLSQLYKKASFLLGASEGEGFGLPLIEAARNGLPLVVRDLPVFREVARHGAHFFPSRRDPMVIADAIKEWTELKSQNAHPKPDVVPWLTWAQSANMLFCALTGERPTENRVNDLQGHDTSPTTSHEGDRIDSGSTKAMRSGSSRRVVQ